MSEKLTKDDLGKIERWARAYMKSKPHGISYWDLHGNDSLTYKKICKLLNMPHGLGTLTKKEAHDLEMKQIMETA